MKTETVVIARTEYEELQKVKHVNQELLEDIVRGIKDVLQGRIKEI